MSRHLKIAEIITRLDRGGSANAVIALCERLDPERFDVTLVTGPSADPAEEPEALAERTGIPVVVVPSLVREVSPRRDLAAFFALRKYLARLRPHVVHTHTSKAGALGRMAAKSAGIPVIHSPHGHLFYGYYGTLGSGLVTLAERALAPLADRIAPLTDASRDDHLDHGVGRHDQFVTVPSGIDLGRFQRDEAAGRAVREELGLTEPETPARTRLRQTERFVVGWMGRFAHVKGPDVFLEACARFAQQGDRPYTSFLMTGEGEWRPRCERLADELGIAGQCLFTGHRDDAPAVLNACDVFVLSSRNEGLGLAAVEAMACGTPVVATDVGGVAEVLDGGRAGLLVPPEQPAAIAAAVLRLAGDEDLRTRLVIAGLKRARAFGLDAMVARFAELYEELADA